jgi:stalled ribosome rescue protein Dom34
MHFHAVVWIDHHGAHILSFGEGAPSRKLFRNQGPERIHHQVGSIGNGHEHNSSAYFAAIAQALSDFHEILVVGPAQARTEFIAYLKSHQLDVAKKILDVAPMDRASGAEIIARGRRLFARAERMTKQR